MLERGPVLVQGHICLKTWREKCQKTWSLKGWWPFIVVSASQASYGPLQTQHTPTRPCAVRLPIPEHKALARTTWTLWDLEKCKRKLLPEPEFVHIYNPLTQSAISSPLSHTSSCTPQTFYLTDKSGIFLTTCSWCTNKRHRNTIITILWA